MLGQDAQATYSTLMPSVLDQILAKPIKVYYEKKPGSPMAVMEFQP